MDWFNLLKEPKLRTGSKITTTLGRDSKEDEEGGFGMGKGASSFYSQSSTGYNTYGSQWGGDEFSQEEPEEPEIPYDPGSFDFMAPSTWPRNTAEFRAWVENFFDLDAMRWQQHGMDLLASVNSISGLSGQLGLGSYDIRSQLAFWEELFGIMQEPIVIPGGPGDLPLP